MMNVLNKIRQFINDHPFMDWVMALILAIILSLAISVVVKFDNSTNDCKCSSKKVETVQKTLNGIEFNK
jgi:hypothetical protein